MKLPSALREFLDAPDMQPVWAKIRLRLEQTGHVVAGSTRVSLTTESAEVLSGLLGRDIKPGVRTVSLPEMDTALMRSSAARGLVAVVAELTGSQLRNRPAERAEKQLAAQQLWRSIDESLAESGLSALPWTTQWVNWLRASGTLLRVPERIATEAFGAAARALAAVLLDSSAPQRMLAELAASVSGDAHALDHGRLGGSLAMRGACFALDISEPVTPRERIALWGALGVTADAVSGTVLTWGLRPPGRDEWSAMMRARSDLGLVTHLTLHELDKYPEALTEDGVVVSACENPQVLQSVAELGLKTPLICFSGNPASAGVILAERIELRYHGDFDWPGVAIAGRVIGAGASPWRMTANDYRSAVAVANSSIPLQGPAVETPWDPGLRISMTATGIAVHEEALISALITDLSETCPR